MQYVQRPHPTGAVQLTLTAHEAQKLEEFLHVAAMSQMTWPLCVGEFMTERKARREVPVDDG